MAEEAGREEWEAEVVERIQTRIREWESTVDVDDSRLYSLGLRHAVEIVRGRDIGLHHYARCGVYSGEGDGTCTCGTTD